MTAAGTWRRGAIAARRRRRSGRRAGQHAAGAPASLETEVVRLRLRHTWTTTMSSSEYRDTLQVRSPRDGVTGIGEGAPIVRYHENAPDAQKALEAARDVVLAADPWRLETLARRGLPPARGPVRRAGRPRHRAPRLDRPAPRRPRLPPARPRPRERPDHHVLDRDRHPRDHAPEGARGGGVPGAQGQGRPRHRRGHDRRGPQRDRQAAARRRERGLEGQGDGDPQDRVARRRRASSSSSSRCPRRCSRRRPGCSERSPIPVFADEACLRASVIPALAGAYHGVNVKLDKAGGLREAAAHDPHRARVRAEGDARLHDLELGQHDRRRPRSRRSSTSPTSTATCWSANDPCEGVEVRDGRLVLPDRPGLGLRRGSPALSGPDAASRLGRARRCSASATSRGSRPTSRAYSCRKPAQVDGRRQEREAVLLDVLEEAQADLRDGRDVPQRQPARLAHPPQVGAGEDGGQVGRLAPREAGAGNGSDRGVRAAGSPGPRRTCRRRSGSTSTS